MLGGILSILAASVPAASRGARRAVRFLAGPRAPTIVLSTIDRRTRQPALARRAAAGRLPVRGGALRDHGAVPFGRLLPLHALPAAHRHRLLGQRPRAAGGLSGCWRARAAARVQAPDGRAQAVLRDLRLGAVQRRPVRGSGGRGAAGDARPRSGHTTAIPAVRRLGRALGADSRGRARAPPALARLLSAARSRSHCSDSGSPQRSRQPSSTRSSSSRSSTSASTSTRPPPSAAGPRRTRYSSPVSLTHAARCSGPSASSRHHSPTSSSRERTRRSSAL